MTWDFTGAVVSDQKLTAAPSVDPTLNAYDAYGNEVYNASNQAYLLLAPGYVPVPRLISISVNTGPASGNTSVTITGTGFSGATAASFGSTAAASYTVNSDNSITAVSPAEPGGTVDITVTNPGGTSATSSSDQFTFVTRPTVTRLSPKNGPVSGGTVVTITGTNLADVTAVNFAENPAGFTIASATSITAYAPAIEAPDTIDVTVSSLGGTSATSAADQFTYTALPKPTVSAVAPSSGPVDGGTSVTITGSGFSNAYAVSFGATPAVSYLVNSATSITAVAPAAAAGAVDVTITAPGGTSSPTAADRFTYVAPPPASGSGTTSRSSGGPGGTKTPTTGGSPAGAAHLPLSMDSRVSPIRRRHHHITFVIRIATGSGRVIVTARRGRHQRHLRGSKSSPGGLTFAADLAAGRWTIIVTYAPGAGYQAPPPTRLRLRIP